ncbi:MAG: hypothetical protein ACE5NC_01735 [Anaerolineae bacterium]
MAQPRQDDALIEAGARRLSDSGWAAPAVLLLEMHRPLSFLASQLLLAAGPLISPLVGRDTVTSYVSLLEDRDGLGRLVSRLEELRRQDDLRED